MISSEPRATVIPVEAGGHIVYLSAYDIANARTSGEETEIAARRPNLDGALEGVRAFAEQAVEQLRGSEVSKVTVEFGCEFAVESGSIIAVIGKAGAKSVMKVSLEWSKPIS